jgi:hypothetical protein
MKRDGIYRFTFREVCISSLYRVSQHIQDNNLYEAGLEVGNVMSILRNRMDLDEIMTRGDVFDILEDDV